MIAVAEVGVKQLLEAQQALLHMDFVARMR